MKKCYKIFTATALLAAASSSVASATTDGSEVGLGDCQPHWDPAVGQPGMYGMTGPFFGGTVTTMEVFEAGGQPVVYAGGTFTEAGGTPVNYIAQWDGENWSPLAGGGVSETLVGGVPNPTCMLRFDDGSGEKLIVGGAFVKAGGITVNGIAQYDGQQWSPMGRGMGGSSNVVRDLVVFQGELYAVGAFNFADDEYAHHVARWDGTGWHPVGGGVTGNALCAAVFDDGNGEAMYVGGVFTSYYDENGDTVSSPYLAKWDGQQWSSVSSTSLNSHVSTMVVFNDGNGPALYIGGLVVWAGPQWISHIGKWDGQNWSAVGGGVDARVQMLEVHDTGDGPTLFVGGEFTMADPYGDYDQAVAVNHVARWDGQSWSAFGSGADDDVLSSVLVDWGDEPEMLFGGRFGTIDGLTANNVATWVACVDDGVLGDLDGNGTVDVSDLLVLLSAWGSCNGTCPADLNDDGSVDVSDLLALLGNWG